MEKKGYALISRDQKEVLDRKYQPSFVYNHRDDIADHKPYWVPIEEKQDPNYDHESEKLGPQIETIYQDRVVLSRGIIKNDVDRLASTEDVSFQQRQILLRNSDWTQLPDSPLSDKKKEEFAVYRNKLRDITKQKSWPRKVTWPKIPEIK
jgi:hypothetical protein